LSYAEKKIVELHRVAPDPDEMMILRDRPQVILKLLKEIKSRVTNENEIVCIDSIITIFESVDDLDFLNKRAIFVYIRELSGLSPKQLSIAMSMIRKHYKELSKSDSFRIF